MTRRMEEWGSREIAQHIAAEARADLARVAAAPDPEWMDADDLPNEPHRGGLFCLGALTALAVFVMLLAIDPAPRLVGHVMEARE